MSSPSFAVPVELLKKPGDFIVIDQPTLRVNSRMLYLRRSGKIKFPYCLRKRGDATYIYRLGKGFAAPPRESRKDSPLQEMIAKSTVSAPAFFHLASRQALRSSFLRGQKAGRIPMSAGLATRSGEKDGIKGLFVWRIA